MTALNYTTSKTSLKPTFKAIEASYLGIIDYNEAVILQNQLADWALVKNLISIVGLQHPSVITLGRRALPLLEIAGAATTIDVVQSSRGGLATLHSLGQLVIYPILNLRQLNLGVRNYVSILLHSTQQLLNDYGIESFVNMETAGLYTEFGKIAFCGIEVRNGISKHGLSLNVSNDLNLFSAIRSCGVANISLDRMKNYSVEISMNEIFQKWISHFRKNLI